MLQFYNNLIVRIAFAIFIVIIAAYDYLLATLLVVCYVLSLQELRTREYHNTMEPPNNQLAKLMVSLLAGTSSNVTDGIASNIPTSGSVLPSLVLPLSNSSDVNYLLKNTNPVDLVNHINTSVDQSNIISPADSTITQNLVAHGLENLSLDQLNVSTSNLIAGVDPTKPIESGQGSNNAQGLNMPLGYDFTAPVVSRF